MIFIFNPCHCQLISLVNGKSNNCLLTFSYKTKQNKIPMAREKAKEREKITERMVFLES